MRDVCTLALLSLCSLGLSCGGGPTPASDAGTSDAPGAPTHATLSWRVRCDAMGGCTPPPARSIDHDDGAGGHAIWCDVTSFDGVNRILEFDAELAPAAYGIHVSGATFPLIGGRVAGDACVVDVIESADGALRGACGSNLPTVDTPCQIDRLMLDVGVLTFRLRCEDMPIVGAPGVLREVGPAATASGNIEVTVTGCRGL